jgi:16S rRNA (cytidine1402-2'-O)-methyltransferase
VATPIGNLEDITFRAVRVLKEVDLIAAEDTRRARILLSHYEIATPTLSFFAGNEARRVPQILQRMEAGQSVALISEAGTPGISDPGWRLIRRCLDAGFAVDAAPGPSAVITALVLAGLPTDRFRWLGFLPRKGRERKKLVAEVAAARETTVLYEAPPRVGATLAELAAVLGPRPAALARELTKLHQEVIREPLDLLARRFADQPPRGEITLLIGGAPSARPDPDAVEAEVRSRLEQGEGPRAIAEALGPDFGRRRVYQLALRLQEQRDRSR